MKLIGESLLEYQNEKGLSQKKLAELIGISSANLCRYQKGTREPSEEELKRICDALDFDYSEYSNIIIKEKKKGVSKNVKTFVGILSLALIIIFFLLFGSFKKVDEGICDIWEDEKVYGIDVVSPPVPVSAFENLYSKISVIKLKNKLKNRDVSYVCFSFFSSLEEIKSGEYESRILISLFKE